RKTRTALVVLMVILGSSLVVVLDGLTAGEVAFLANQFNLLSNNVLFVTPGQLSFRSDAPSTSSLVINNVIVERIKSLPYIQDVVPQYSGSVKINSQGNIQQVSVTSMDPTKLTVEVPNVEYVDGSTIDPNDRVSALVGDTVANPPGAITPFVTIGQTIRATYTYSDPTGKQLTESKNFLVTGIMKPSGSSLIDKSLVINLDAGNQLLHKSVKYDFLLVSAISPDYVDSVQQEIQDQFGTTIGVTSPKAIMTVIGAAAAGNAAFIQMIGIISLVVASIGIATTMYASVTERIREIGTMKAIGAQNNDILVLFLTESGLIGLMGATLGLAIGVGAGYLMISLISSQGPSLSISAFTPVFMPLDLAKVWLLSVALAIAAGSLPAWKASKLSPIIALGRD
ncbi:MAG: ABC transporter permease, partial [Nitrosotalea sp.]